jgi:uncharacterized protein
LLRISKQTQKNKYQVQAKGKILWTDLTVENADEIKDFYGSVIGWTFSEQPVADYVDYNVHNALEHGDECIAGICHKKGSNVNIPAQWLNYVIVKNLRESLANCQKLGGKTIDGPRKMGKNMFAVIQDPAGAYLALMETTETAI